MSATNNTANKPWAVVTGASSGIGHELAEEFARSGFNLLIVAEDDGIVQAADEIRQPGCEVQSVQEDLSQPEGLGVVYREIRKSRRPFRAKAILRRN